MDDTKRKLLSFEEIAYAKEHGAILEDLSISHEEAIRILTQSLKCISLSDAANSFLYSLSISIFPHVSLLVPLLPPLCGLGFLSKSDFSAIFFSHFFSSSDSFLKFSLSLLQMNIKDAVSGSLSSLTVSSTACKKPFSGLSSGTLKKSSLWVSRRSRAILLMSCCIT